MEKNTILKQVIGFVSIIALSVSAGAATASIIANSFVGSVGGVTPEVIIPYRVSTNVNATKVSESVRSAVSIYKKRASTSALEKILLPSDQVGAGLVLTSDGWIVTTSAVIEGYDELIAVFSDKTTAYINPLKAIHDEATGIVYLKTEGIHLTVASFGDDLLLHQSDSVFLVDANSVNAASVVSTHQLSISSKTDFVESTEKLSRKIKVSANGVSGALVVDANGLVIGVSLGDGTLVPATYITQVLRSIFKDGKVTRPQVGLHYVSLDLLPNPKDLGLGVTGALVMTSGKLAGVTKGSAAAEAGIIEGDVIVAIERDRINDDVTLSERIQDYVPGSSVEFTLMRKGKQIKVPLTFK